LYAVFILTCLFLCPALPAKNKEGNGKRAGEWLSLVQQVLYMATTSSAFQPPAEFQPCAESATDVVLVVHGGAGTILPENLTPQLEGAFRQSLASALRAGYAILQRGESATDAVEASVRLLEDDPLFNAGHGAVFTADGRNELDAAIMDGATGKAGAVAGVTKPKNPITLARAVMERTPFVFLAGAGADSLATELRLEEVDPEYFRTETRWKQLKEQQRRETEGTASGDDGFTMSLSEDNKFGTVGAVAVDAAGNIAGATSTGGMTNKRYGRVGDSPVIGAGTWAENATCAVSATGHGEYFLRAVVAHDIAARMRYAGASVAKAAGTVIHQIVKDLGGGGGVIAIDRHGNATLPFNTAGMYRGYITRDGTVHVSIYGG
jgi:beta-aspartyl-peptidase (threonine type)